MLALIGAIIVIAWLLGPFAFHVTGGLIHLALVVGVPMDFRLGFGASFGEDTEIVVIDVAEPERRHPRAVAAECYGDVAATLTGLREAAGAEAGAGESWVSELKGD